VGWVVLDRGGRTTAEHGVDGAGAERQQQLSSYMD
jgi:hypothetical protein